MKPIKSTALRAYERERAESASRVEGYCKGLSTQLVEAGWTGVTIKAIGGFTSVGATDPQGNARSGCRVDGEALVDDLLGLGVPPPQRTPSPVAAPDNVPWASPDVRAALDPIVPMESEELTNLRARIAELESRPPEIREVEKIVERVVEVPAAVVEEEAAPADGIPDEFRALMWPEELPEKFTERMKRRWQYLKHIQIDGAKPTRFRALPDMTDAERVELADLETRNKSAKWLD